MGKTSNTFRLIPVAGTVTFLLGAAIGWFAPPSQVAQPRQRSHRSSVETDGERRLLDVAPSIDEVSRETAKSAPSVLIHWDVENLLPEEARFTYSWVLSNDRWKELYQGRGNSQAVEQKGFSSTEGWEIPPLEDGYYRIELTTVLRSKSGTIGNSVTPLFLEVRRGEVTEITGDQWELESRANVAVEVGS